MKIYSISVIEGREVIARDVAIAKSDVNYYVNNEKYKDNFIIVDSYTRKDKWMTRDSELRLDYIRTYVFLRGVEVHRQGDFVYNDGLDRIKSGMTTVFKLDGTRNYIPDMPLSTPEVQEITGTEIFTMRIIKDEPPVRWAVFSTDINQYGLEQKPALNKVASELFGVELYGDVLLINENFVA